jgi:ElaB/YqjD/DUF883 family membrane-anchored ribosome-binding protein
MRPHDQPGRDPVEVVVVRPGPAHDDEARLRTDIDGTRADMSETIDAIQERLSPDHVGEQVERVAEQVKEQIRESVQELTAEARVAIREATVGRVENMIGDARDSVNELRYGLVDRVRANPVPAAIAGLGLAWLLFGDSGRSSGRRYYRETRYRYGGAATADYPRRAGAYSAAWGNRGDYRGAYGADAAGAPDYAERWHEGDAGTAEQLRQRAEEARARAERMAGDARERVGEMAGEAAERVGEMAGGARERVDDLAEVAAEQAYRARDRVGEMLGESPLALGAIAIGIGAAVGLALPSTEPENEWLGETRDQLMARAKDTVADVGQQARTVAEETLSKAS